jgi:E-phenylitaconyl-CoA hydratase
MPIDFEVADRIATITINRPESLNAMSPDMYQALSESWVEVRDNPDIWVAVVTGAPQPNRPPARQVFSAGADLKAMGSNTPEAYRFWQTQNDQLLNRGLEVWKPIVAAVNGLCLAGGMTLLLATDIRIASEHAAFDLSEVKRGILPGNGGTQRLTRLIGRTKALDMMITGTPVNPKTAHALGFVDKLFPADSLLEETISYARKLASGATLAIGRIKQAVYEGLEVSLDESLALERDLMEPLFDTADAKEGIAAFAEKRQPTYTGR